MDLNLIKKNIKKYSRYDKDKKTLYILDRFWLSYSLSNLEKLGLSPEQIGEIIFN